MDTATPLPKATVPGEWTACATVAEEDGVLRCCQSDPLCYGLLGRWRLGERGVALLTLILGFGVLTTWYLVERTVDPAARGRRGPFEYYSASLGDLVLLPLLNAAAVRYTYRVVGGLLAAAASIRRRARRRLALIESAYRTPRGRAFALAVVVVAVALQHVDELYGIDRNWTVPVWGHLRLAALYHQAFFACEAAIVAFLVVRHTVTVRLLLRLARDTASRAETSAVAERSLRIFGWVLLGWGAFVSLRVMDFFHLTPTVSALALAALPAPMTALAVYYLALMVTGVAPTVAVGRRYGLGRTHAPVLLVATSLVVPIAGPAARILVARLLAA